MVFVCGQCHYDFEHLTKTGQCPDCGKRGYIHPATAEEAEQYRRTKLEGDAVWENVMPVQAS